MQIKIGENTLEVISAGAKRHASGKVIVIIQARQDVISHDDLRAMFKDTTEDLEVTRDDGTKETIGGCHYVIKVHDDVLDGVEIHRAEIECSSEADFQLGRLRGAVNTHDTAIANHGTAIKAQAQELVAHKTVLDAQGQEVEAQKGMTEYLEQMSGSLLMAIDSLVLEVLPAAISDAVELALQKMQESNNSEMEEVETEEGGDE